MIAKLADAALTHRASSLKFERIRGDISFSEVDGLASTGLVARFWDQELRATIHTGAHAERRREIALALQGLAGLIEFGFLGP